MGCFATPGRSAHLSHVKHVAIASYFGDRDRRRLGSSAGGCRFHNDCLWHRYDPPSHALARHRFRLPLPKLVRAQFFCRLGAVRLVGWLAVNARHDHCRRFGRGGFRSRRAPTGVSISRRDHRHGRTDGRRRPRAPWRLEVSASTMPASRFKV